MTSRTRSASGDSTAAFVSWLVTGAVGPALVALPVNLAADRLADAAVRWFKRFRQTDDLSRLVKAAAGTSVQLSRDEISCLRKLLEKEQTWSLLSGGKLHEKLHELTGQIVGCMPPRDSRSAEDARQAAGAIARGLVEFAVFSLRPEIFQKVALARLQQMTDRLGALDQALFAMHKDLYHLVGEAKDLFKYVMDGLPPGPADLIEVKLYLKTLIDWLNADPWPRDSRLSGPVLAPAAIERKLRVSVTSTAHKESTDADELVWQCSRLVILGGPGSGKTWLAKRTARRCAEEALSALEEGAVLDEVELPLFTTCSRMVSEPGDIREAAVSSAIERIGDLGSSRVIKALRLFFTERDRRTLLVIDSLDEASDVGQARDRLRQADSLRPPWRVVLTSRPGSWNNQVTIEKENQDQQVGEIEPLRYPDDVEAIIQQWFADEPASGHALLAQVARRPSLQQATTVPLILAFYCILGASRPLPGFRHEVYKQVINRMLHGSWRSGNGPPPDPDVCREALRTWAWQAAKDNPVSGVGQWEDDILTQQAQLSAAGQTAVDHIAPPLGGPDFDTDEILRRFVHRSIREHLVAEHVASLPLGRAVEELLPHLWYDADWEYAAPAAIVMHVRHGEVLQALLSDVRGCDEISGDLSAIDAGGEVHGLLARVAAESKEDDWPPDLATIIGQARVELARSGIVGDLGEAAHWPTSNRQVRQVLLGQLNGDAGDWIAPLLASTLARLDPAPEDEHAAVSALLRDLTGDVAGWRQAELVDALVQLNPETDDRDQAVDALLRQLTGRFNRYDAARVVDALVRINPEPGDKRKARDLLLSLLVGPDACSMSDAVDVTSWILRLIQTQEDKHQAREAVLRLLVDNARGLDVARLADMLTRLDRSYEGMHRALDVVLGLAADQPHSAATFLAAAIDLAQTRQDKRRTLNVIRRLLDDQADDMMTAELAAMVVLLDPAPSDKRRAADALLGLLLGDVSSLQAVWLADTLARLDPEPNIKCQARRTLLALLATDPGIGGLASALAQLDPTPDDKRKARKMLLAQLPTAPAIALSNDATSEWSAVHLMALVNRLDPEPDDKRQARSALLAQLTNHATGAVTGLKEALWLILGRGDTLPDAELAALLLQLDPTLDDKRQALNALLSLLTHKTGGRAAVNLAAAILQLNPEPADMRKARDAFLARLTDRLDGSNVDWLATALIQLDPTPDDKRRAREALLGWLRDENIGVVAGAVAMALTRLGATPDHMRQAREALLGQLPGPGPVTGLLSAVLQLAATPQDKREVRGALLGLLARETDSAVAAELIRVMAQLDPTVHDVSTWRTWTATPTAELLSAARRNTALDEWIAALPSMSTLVCRPHMTRRVVTGWGCAQ
jgi:hypothetical protein